MLKRMTAVASVLGLAVASTTLAQYPILDMVADRVVQKYQSSTCEQLWQNRGKHSQREMEVVQTLRENPEMRREFLNRIAGPVLNRMFECGMVP